MVETAKAEEQTVTDILCLSAFKAH